MVVRVPTNSREKAIKSQQLSASPRQRWPQAGHFAGVRQSGRHPSELPIAIEAVKMWPKLSEELGAFTSYR